MLLVIIVWIFLVLCLCFGGLFMLYRNEWLLDEKLRLIKRDFEKTKQLPDYNYMLKKFWIWDIEKFL